MATGTIQQSVFERYTQHDFEGLFPRGNRCEPARIAGVNYWSGEATGWFLGRLITSSGDTMGLSLWEMMDGQLERIAGITADAPEPYKENTQGAELLQTTVHRLMTGDLVAVISNRLDPSTLVQESQQGYSCTTK